MFEIMIPILEKSKVEMFIHVSVLDVFSQVAR